MVKNIVSKQFKNVSISPSVGTIIICHVSMTILGTILYNIYPVLSLVFLRAMARYKKYE